ncbi:MAG: hypothetical protein LC792_06675 [Actinobacteria bacterium]|nr:hypothetical protein [Actinomycetota bacterium]
MTSTAPTSVSSPRRAGNRRLVVAVAAAIGVVVAAIAGIAAAGGSSVPTPETTTSTVASTAVPASQAPAAETLDVSGFLPPFHEELKRLVAPRPDGQPALLVASSPRQDSPRPVTFTLLEWDRSGYRVADTVELDCGFLEQLVVDEDQAIFLGCGGGASAHWAWALLPDRLHIGVLPAPGDGSDTKDGWLITSFKTVPKAGQPDDLVLYAKRCDPSCADGKIDQYRLDWDSTFRQWELVECTPEGRVAHRYDSPMNGSVADITYNGCPFTPVPPAQPSVDDLPGE